ncbi:flagellar hook-basal body complex protein [Devosia sp. RR2S18]|uniref:flagellar hook-basal body complex protein n=1 Tax=Devosia rhizosphaerae TaxID=3049774 RepID=UPI00253F861F|nr:flagellar hook-basal body complex protein [Devosia sp. RR2S18]WIJ24054.1 flagellar hook-basal body complex protein [Devosia sp. RR2S18]
MVAFNAMYNAVAGMQAQSFALQNISGNIANSRTAGYKRIDSSFSELLGPDATGRAMGGSSITFSSKANNTASGDIVASSIGTNMALTGNQFFVSQTADGQTVYTRRGDFRLDALGNLTNGSGLRLGAAGETNFIDQEGELAQKPSTSIDYNFNLPSLPMPPSYDPKVPGSGNLATTPRTTIRVEYPYPAGDLVSSDDLNTGEEVVLTYGDRTQRFVFNTGEGTMPPLGPDDIEVDATGTHDDMMEAIEAAVKSRYPEASGATVYIDDENYLVVELEGDYSEKLEVTTTFAGMTATASGTFSPGLVGNIAAPDERTFLDGSIPGGAATLYDDAGQNANLDMRWAKISSQPGNETWALYYLGDAAATEGQPKWVKAGEYQFNGTELTEIRNAAGEPVGTAGLQLRDVVINGKAFGDLTLKHAAGEVTQFFSASGQVRTTELQQNGNAKGKFVSVEVSENGQLYKVFDNGLREEAGTVRLVRFKAPEGLTPGDNGGFFASAASGDPIAIENVQLISGAVEGSNTDIPREFEALILTQQAYSANTQVASTVDKMLGKALDAMR